MTRQEQIQAVRLNNSQKKRNSFIRRTIFSLLAVLSAGCLCYGARQIDSAEKYLIRIREFLYDNSRMDELEESAAHAIAEWIE